MLWMATTLHGVLAMLAQLISASSVVTTLSHETLSMSSRIKLSIGGALFHLVWGQDEYDLQDMMSISLVYIRTGTLPM
jgi:hypothetical protein